MLKYIKARLIEAHPQYVIIQMMGMGIKVFIPASFYFDLPDEGEEITIYTYLQVKEDGLNLYGFQAVEERDIFEILVGVSGIGPKVALSILGHLSLAELYDSVVNENYAVLTSIPGIGNKTARRIVYELKEKIAEQKIDTELFKPAGDGEEGVNNWSDVEEALLALGYSSQEISRVKKHLSSKLDHSVEILFKEALGYLAGSK